MLANVRCACLQFRRLHIQNTQRTNQEDQSGYVSCRHGHGRHCFLTFRANLHRAMKTKGNTHTGYVFYFKSTSHTTLFLQCFRFPLHASNYTDVCHNLCRNNDKSNFMQRHSRNVFCPLSYVHKKQAKSSTSDCHIHNLHNLKIFPEGLRHPKSEHCCLFFGT